MHKDVSRFARFVPGTILECIFPLTSTLDFGGAGFPFQYADELRFADDSYLTTDEVDRAKAAGKFTTIIPVEKDTRGLWHARFNLRASKTTNFPGILPDYYK